MFCSPAPPLQTQVEKEHLKSGSHHTRQGLTGELHLLPVNYCTAPKVHKLHNLLYWRDVSCADLCDVAQCTMHM